MFSLNRKTPHKNWDLLETSTEDAPHYHNNDDNESVPALSSLEFVLKVFVQLPLLPN